MTEATPTLPDRSFLLHIGTMKSGTSSLQFAASQRREELLADGVCYPGKSLNHYSPAFAFLGSRREGVVPPRVLWDRLMDETQKDSVRVSLVSHERICEAGDHAVQKFADEVGPPLHVLVTLRPLTGMLGSFWQQQVKTGALSVPFSDWLEQVLAPLEKPRKGDLFQRHSDHGGIVERWARVVGPERVTVVVGDKNEPRLLSRSVEQMLGVREGLLTPDGSPTGENRSLSMSEAELLRRANEIFEESGVPWAEYGRVYRRAAFTRMLSGPRIEGDPGITLPGWAADAANQLGRESAEMIRASGVSVIGDLTSLYAPQRAEVVDAGTVPSSVPIEVAAAALVGTVGGGLGRGPFLDKEPPTRSQGQPSQKPRRLLLGSARLDRAASRISSAAAFRRSKAGRAAIRFGRRWLSTDRRV